jgi:hypothetical protein
MGDASPALVVVWVTMAPIPVLLLVFAVLFVVDTIRLVPFVQVTPVRAFFAVIPAQPGRRPTRVSLWVVLQIRNALSSESR